MRQAKWIIFMAAGLLAASAPAWAQSRLDAETLKLYGGTYSADCSSAAAPRLRVAADTLAVERGNKRLTGRNAQASYSFFGQSPPPDYQVALMSDVRPGLQMLFIVYRDKSGQYITLDGDSKVQAALGRDLLGRKYRSCNPTAKEAPRPAAPAPAKASVDATIGPPELLLDAKFKSIYYKALGPKVKEPWLAELDGPAPPVKKITIAGTEYLFATACKNHDCGDNNTVLLYSAAQAVVYGKVLQQRRASFIGAPPPAIAAELDRLWAVEWRQNR
jgi:hypothetical protein